MLEFFQGVSNFNGQHGCLKCCTVGSYSSLLRTNIYHRTIAPKRTDAIFRAYGYGKHHLQYVNRLENRRVQHVPVVSPLLELPIDIIEDVIVADSLHLLHLGMMKRILKAFKDGEKRGYDGFKWSKSAAEEVSESIKTIILPYEIHRSARGLDVLPFWKGSECGVFLNYIGVALFKQFVPEHEYKMFLHLFCAVTICSCSYFTRFLPIAQSHFESFIRIARKTFKTLSSNIHNLVHIVDEIKRFGTLNTISSYPFENQLYQIKRKLRSGHLPLQQIMNRISEETMPNYDATIIEYPLYTKLDKDGTFLHILLRNGFNLNTNYTDKWFLSTDKVIFAFKKTNEGFIICSKLKMYESAFNEPLVSTYLNVFSSEHVCQLEDEQSIPISNVLCKLVAINVKNITTFVPLHHTYPDNLLL